MTQIQESDVQRDETARHFVNKTLQSVFQKGGAVVGQLIEAREAVKDILHERSMQWKDERGAIRRSWRSVEKDVFASLSSEDQSQYIKHVEAEGEKIPSALTGAIYIASILLLGTEERVGYVSTHRPEDRAEARKNFRVAIRLSTKEPIGRKEGRSKEEGSKEEGAIEAAWRRGIFVSEEVEVHVLEGSAAFNDFLWGVE